MLEFHTIRDAKDCLAINSKTLNNPDKSLSERLLALINCLSAEHFLENQSFSEDWITEKITEVKELRSLIRMAERRASIDAKLAYNRRMEKEFDSLPNHLKESFGIEFDHDNGEWDVILEY